MQRGRRAMTRRRASSAVWLSPQNPLEACQTGAQVEMGTRQTGDRLDTLAGRFSGFLGGNRWAGRRVPKWEAGPELE
jgi:hypothetical protein